MILNILRDRFIRLGRDEDGVALVVTLGVFMFMYVTCASVYAVGWAVKEKLQLQGACDAAAYSAAVVQADTFSRIATINRAMSWTYQQMTRRQMDYIVWQWLEEVIEHHNFDLNKAKRYAYNNNQSTDGFKCRHNPHCYDQGIGWDCSDITLEGSNLRGPYTEDQLRNWAETGFSASLRKNAASFYSRHGATLRDLGDQIDDDLLNIYQMSETVDRLARELPGRVDVSTMAILKANVPAFMTRGDCQYFVRQERNPRMRYFKTFSNTAYDEQIFLSYDDYEVKSPTDIFGAGIDKWFVRGDGRRQDGGPGIHRSYDHTLSGPPLRANWTWWATGWTCGTIGPYHWHIPNGFKISCGHSHDKCLCTDNGMFKESYTYGVRETVGSFGVPFFQRLLTYDVVRHNMYARCSADSNRHSEPYGAYDNPNVGRYDNRFKGHLKIRQNGRLVESAVYARPLKLTEDYFGPAGTITVGFARRNENPWFSLFGRVTGGLYSAFSPIANSWSYCFASAKAGYKLYHEPNDWYANLHLGSRRLRRLDDWEENLNGNVRVENGPRDYCIDWKPEESKFAGWYWTYKKDDDGNYIIRNGRRVRDKLITEWTMLDDLRPTWRQSWNLVQDDWDAVMVPVRQGGSSAREVANYSLREWWEHRLSGQYENLTDIPDRYEPAWQDRDRSFLARLVNSANWQVLSGADTPITDVVAGSTWGDRGDTLNGILAGDLWFDHWYRGAAAPTATGTSMWNIENPGARLNWNQIGDEMYH